MAQMTHFLKIGNTTINVNNICWIRQNSSTQADIMFVDGRLHRFEGEEAELIEQTFRDVQTPQRRTRS